MLIKHARKTHTSNPFEKTLNANRQTKKNVDWLILYAFEIRHLLCPWFWDIHILGHSSLGSSSSCWSVTTTVRVGGNWFVET